MADDGRDDGFVLIVVLLVLAILAVISVGFSRAVQSQLRNTSSAVRSAEAEFLADAGVNLVTLDLVSVRNNRLHAAKFGVDGTPAACRISDRATLAVTVQDASGLINLNLADDRLIMAILMGSGISPSLATEYAHRVLDFRDGTNTTLQSAEAAEAFARLRQSRKTTGFASLLELHQVPGLPGNIVALLQSASTLSSGTAGLDPNVTAAALLAKIKTGLSQLPSSGGIDFGILPPEFSASSLKRYYHVRATAWLDGQGAFVREAEIDLQAGRSMPVLKAWTRGDDARQADVAPADRAGLPSC